MVNNPTLLGLISIVLAGTMMNADAITIAHGGDSVDIDFVNIGNVGNIGDTAVAGYGAVNYEYSIGKYEVTADQWAAVIAADSVVGNGGLGSGSQPTRSTNWYEAALFSNWLTSGNALMGAYTFSGGTFTGVDRVTALTTYGTIYMLPTEDEWYKAAYLKSDGTAYTPYATGGGAGLSTDANYSNGGSFVGPWDVGTGTVENNGTYDMGGNVWEWTESALTGGEPTGAEMRTRRGGGWGSYSTTLHSSGRNGLVPGNGSPTTDVGFRVASVSAAVAVVPEPSSVGLLVIGAMGCMLRRKRG